MRPECQVTLGMNSQVVISESSVLGNWAEKLREINQSK